MKDKTERIEKRKDSLAIGAWNAVPVMNSSKLGSKDWRLPEEMLIQAAFKMIFVEVYRKKLQKYFEKS